MSGDTPEIRVDREGIHIDREVADSVSLDEELDSNLAGEYRFPPPARRRYSAWVYAAAAVPASLLIPGGWVIGLCLVILAVWHFMASWPLAVDAERALALAAKAVRFPVGHASAAVRFTGWRSRPRWSVLLYSASDPPDQRALVVVDAVEGSIVETPYVEEIAPP